MNSVVNTLIDARNFIVRGKGTGINVREKILVERINAIIELLIDPESTDQVVDVRPYY